MILGAAAPTIAAEVTCPIILSLRSSPISITSSFQSLTTDTGSHIGNNIAAGDFLYEQWVYEKGQEAGLLGKLPVPFW